MVAVPPDRGFPDVAISAVEALMKPGFDEKLCGFGRLASPSRLAT